MAVVLPTEPGKVGSNATAHPVKRLMSGFTGYNLNGP
jgi:hypothetical protein